jgi:hypothetical protein
LGRRRARCFYERATSVKHLGAAWSGDDERLRWLQSGLVFAIGDPSQCVSFRMGSLGPQAVHDVIDWINNGAPQ